MAVQVAMRLGAEGHTMGLKTDGRVGLAVPDLVERFDIELFSDFSAK